MNKDYVEPMVADENGNIYFSAKYLSENKDKEIERLHSIIKEVREYINCNKQKTIGAYGDNEDDDFEICLFEEDIDKLLEILDKENKI